MKQLAATMILIGGGFFTYGLAVKDNSIHEGHEHNGSSHIMTHPGMDHSGHAMPDGTETTEGARHDRGPPVIMGPWSYHGRKLAEPHKTGDRWEMIPVPGYGHMYLNADQVSAELKCAALRDNPGIMVDRATRRACGMPEKLF
jgi:hypothetical protein